MVNISIALLNKPVENVARHTQTLIYFIVFRGYNRYCIGMENPVIDLAWMKRILNWIMLNEKIGSVLRDKQSCLEKTWSPWLSYLQVPDTRS